MDGRFNPPSFFRVFKDFVAVLGDIALLQLVVLGGIPSDQHRADDL